MTTSSGARSTAQVAADARRLVLTSDSGRHWVFVDLAAGLPRFFVVPEPDVVAGIRERHRDCLARNGGHRVQNDDSVHCKVTTADVAEGADRWDLASLPCI